MNQYQFQRLSDQFRSDERTCPEVSCLTYQASSVNLSHRVLMFQPFILVIYQQLICNQYICNVETSQTICDKVTELAYQPLTYM